MAHELARCSINATMAAKMLRSEARSVQPSHLVTGLLAWRLFSNRAPPTKSLEKTIPNKPDARVIISAEMAQGRRVAEPAQIADPAPRQAAPMVRTIVGPAEYREAEHQAAECRQAPKRLVGPNPSLPSHRPLGRPLRNRRSA